MTKNVWLSAGATAAISVAVFYGSAAHAQSAAPAGTAAAAPSVEEVIVTAQKRTEAVRDIPATVSAFSAKKLEAYHVGDLGGISLLAPSVQAEQGMGRVEFNVRGINAGITQGTFEEPVAVHVDGFYVAHPFELAGTSLLDVQRVEVVAGPQGTLYGRNATAGAVNIITNKPSDHYEFLASEELSWITDNGALGGGYGEKTTLIGNAPLMADGRVRARLAIVRQDHSGDFTRIDAHGNKHDAGDEHDTAARLTIAADLTNRVRWTVAADVYQANDDSNFADVEAVGSPASLTGVTVYGGHGHTGGRTFYADYEQPTREFGAAVSSTLEWQISDHLTARSLTGFRYGQDHHGWDFDGTEAPISSDPQPMLAMQYSEEDQLVWTSKKLKALVGFYYFKDIAKQDFGPIGLYFGQAAGGAPIIAYLQQDGKNRGEVYAGFADATYSLLDNLDITLGLRYSSETRSGFQNVYFNLEPVVGDHSGDIYNVTPLPAKTYDSFTPRAVIKFRPTDETMVYASFSKGFKSGGYNVGDPAQNTPYSPEKLTAYEIGFKGEALDRRLSVSISGFYYDYTDLQVDINKASSIVLANAASAVVRGIDLQGEFTPIRDLAFDAALEVLDAKFSEGMLADGLLGTPPQSVAGMELPKSSPVSATLGVRYNWNISSGRFETALVGHYEGHRFFTAPNDPYLAQNPSFMLNASITYRPEGSPFSVGLFGTNLTNAQVLTGAFGGNPGVGMNRFAMYNRPRIIGIRFDYAMR